MNVGGLAAWLVERADAGTRLNDLFVGFCERLADGGLPVWRATLGLETLHPEHAGWLLVWQGGALVPRASYARAGILQAPNYVNSPTRIVDETDAPFRCHIAEGPGDMPLMQELAAEGATDYYMLPLPFLDRSRSSNMSFATRQAGGFADGELSALVLAAKLLSPYAERVAMRQVAIEVLDSYVGRLAGQRVLDGQIERGEVRTIAAAIWCCDLRGFTAMSERLPRGETVALLNRWFDAVGAALEPRGGEILKFMGDGLLAAFTGADACARALEAAQDAIAGCERLNAQLAAEGRATLAFGLGLHVGDVEFGNIGTHDRLDFTVIGPAVNQASRLQDLSKTAGSPIVASADFAAACGRPMRHLGSRELRGVEQPVETYGI
ncbi:MAG TPA: adenylate/guanylate cyclase domain-containing protein [Geminicoccaceae bacterium]|nr:adenylate/guanylate cyclase domain-containing protein [Geminicoccus sp.]HMU50166.1 adenylate/guanylate cyclase domain-containing protein [Geminicoccaceae bacterium]